MTRGTDMAKIPKTRTVAYHKEDIPRSSPAKKEDTTIWGPEKVKEYLLSTYGHEHPDLLVRMRLKGLDLNKQSKPKAR